MNALSSLVFELSRALVGWLGSALLLGSVLAGLTWLLVRVLRGRSIPSLEVGLWTVVLVKFLVPFGPQWSYSLPSLCNSLFTAVPMQDVFDAGWDAQLDVLPPGLSAAALGPEAARREQTFDWICAIGILYLAAVGLLLLRRILRHLQFVRYCRALPLADGCTRTLVRSVCRRLAVRRVPSVRISNDCTAPFILGFARPLLVLARRQLVRPDELETVVVHEITHLRRGDLYLRCLQWIAGTFLFFWPVVHWVNRRIDMAREHACDRWALRYGRLNACEYARCLLDAVPPRSALSMVFRPTCMAGRITNIERRIDMILKMPEHQVRRPVVRLLGLSLVLAWCGFVLTGAVGARHRQVSKDDLQSAEMEVDASLKKIYSEIAGHAAGDVNGDGEISFNERNAFLVTLFQQSPDAALRSFSYAAPSQGREMDFWDAYDTVRGLSFRKSVSLRAELAMKSAYEEQDDEDQRKMLKLEYKKAELDAVRKVLDAQLALLSNIALEPDPDAVEAALKKIEKVEESDKSKELEKKLQHLHQKLQELELQKQDDSQKAEELRSKALEIQQLLKSAQAKGR